MLLERGVSRATRRLGRARKRRHVHFRIRRKVGADRRSDRIRAGLPGHPLVIAAENELDWAELQPRELNLPVYARL